MNEDDISNDKELFKDMDEMLKNDLKNIRKERKKSKKSAINIAKKIYKSDKKKLRYIKIYTFLEKFKLLKLYNKFKK